MKDNRHAHHGEDDSEDDFDLRVDSILNTETAFLREQAQTLLETGSISIQRPGGTLTAQFRHIYRWRPGKLHLDAVSADGSRHASVHGPSVSKYRDRAGVIDEIILTLAVHLAWLEDEA